jgi:hypothetical protein
MVSTSFVFNPTIREGLSMPTTIRYADILNYLTAIMNKENNPISESPHLEWWSGLSYNDFKTGSVTNLGVPIMDSSNPLQSNFYVILTSTNGLPDQGFPQMPYGGPYITDANYTATLPNGQTISGTQIAANMQSWLSNGFPE